MDSRAPSIDEPGELPLRPLSSGDEGTKAVRRDRALRFAERTSWVVLATCSVALFIASLPAYVSDVREVCAGSDCSPLSMTPENASALAERGLSVNEYALILTLLAVVFAASCYAVSFLIFLSKPGEPVAWFSSMMLIIFGTTFPQTVQSLNSPDAIGNVVSTIESLGVVCLIAFFYLFPDGRFVPRWTKWLLIGVVVVTAMRLALPGSAMSWANVPPFLRLTETLIWTGSVLIAQAYRYRAVSNHEERQQTKWVISGIAGALAGLVIVVVTEDVLDLTPAGTVADLAKNSFIIATFLLIPITLGIAILRHRLWDIDFIINRALVYGTLTLLVAGTYVVVVGYLGTLLRTDRNLLVSLIATGVVAVLFQPVRERIQRGVNRMIYGDRDEPYAVVARLGQRLEGTPAPGAVLPMVVQTVAEALKLPFAAITVRHDDAYVLTAEHGVATDDPLCLPLVYHGETVGELLLAPRVGEHAFSDSDRLLLEDLTRQVGVAVHAVRLTEDLQRSRERLVAAREEERRRLRRDLHDGLGPQLASQTLALDAAIHLLHDDPDAASELLRHVKDQSRAAVAEIRRLVYDLRPPALDDLGLIAALRDHADRFRHGDLLIAIEAPESLPDLPAAIEVAAYRIVQEAITNVVRHAEAQTCATTLRVDQRTLIVEVLDDGVGFRSDRASGVGLNSMRERAEESGGTLTIDSEPGVGTRVLAQLPLPEEIR